MLALELALLACSVRSAGSAGPRVGVPPFDGAFAGLPEPDLSNRRCGDGHNGVRDMTSAMCKGSSTDGRLALPLAQARGWGASAKGDESLIANETSTPRVAL